MTSTRRPVPGVDEHGHVDKAAAQREVVDPEHPRRRHLGQGDLQEDPQRGMPGDQDAQRRQQPRRGRPANSRATVLTWAVSRQMRRW